MNENNEDVLFIDAYNLIYRAYHGNQSNLTNSEGIPTNAIFTVARMLLKLPQQFEKLKYAVAVFDGGGNFRKDLDENYKANRSEMPENLKLQMPYLKQVFELLGWPIIQADMVEADDIIGTLALRSAKKGFNTYIISSDKDFRSIVSENLNIIDTMHDKIYDRQAVFDKMGVYPENVRGWLALVGDSADNVPGVDKVGPGTAAKLLNLYGSLQGIIDNKADLKNKTGENIRASIESGQLLKSYELVQLKTDCEITVTGKQISMTPVNENDWNAFCTKMNMNSLLKKPKP